MKIEKRDGSQERRILTAMIVDDGVLARLSGKWVKEGLFNSRWANIVGGWCCAYFEKYGKAPAAATVGLFETWCEENNDKDTISLVERFLEGLSADYEALAKESNTDFLIDLAGEYFDKIRLSKLAENIQADLDRGDVAKARSRAEGYDGDQTSLRPQVRSAHRLSRCPRQLL